MAESNRCRAGRPGASRGLGDGHRARRWPNGATTSCSAPEMRQPLNRVARRRSPDGPRASYGGRRRCHRRGRAAPLDRRGPRARRAGRARQQRVGAWRHRSAASTFDVQRFGRMFPGQRRCADRADPAGGAAARRTRRPDRQHHERRRARGVSRLGALRRQQSGARAVDADARRRTARAAAFRPCSSIPATCGRACIRRRSRARTSRIVRCPK